MKMKDEYSFYYSPKANGPKIQKKGDNKNICDNTERWVECQ